MNMLNRLQKRTGEKDAGLLMDCLVSARNAIMTRRYPYGEWPTDSKGEPKLDVRYQDLQYRIALDLYFKIGAEGETSHSENGISRVYESSWISDQLLSEVTPYVGVV